MGYMHSVKSEVAALQGGGRGKALLVVAAGSFLTVGLLAIYPVMLPEVRAEYGLDLTTGGFLLTVLWITYAAGQVPGGILADRIGETATLILGVGIPAVSLSLILIAGSALALFGMTAFLGLGLGIYGIVRYTVLEDLYPDRVGATVGLVLSAADVGQSVLPPLAGFVAVVAVWQLGFGLTIPLFVCLAVLFWVYIPSHAGAETDESEEPAPTGVRNLLSRTWSPQVGYGAAILIMYLGVWVAFTSLYPTYLVEQKGLSSSLGALLFGMFFAIGALVKPIAGVLYDRFSVRTALLPLMLPAIGALVLLPVAEGLVSLVFVTAVIAPVTGSGTIAQSYLVEVLADEVRGTGLGIIRTAALALAALTPLLFSAVAERGFFDEVFLVLAGVIALIALLVVFFSTFIAPQSAQE